MVKFGPIIRRGTLYFSVLERVIEFQMSQSRTLVSYTARRLTPERPGGQGRRVFVLNLLSAAGRGAESRSGTIVGRVVVKPVDSCGSLTRVCLSIKILSLFTLLSLWGSI